MFEIDQVVRIEIGAAGTFHERSGKRDTRRREMQDEAEDLAAKVEQVRVQGGGMQEGATPARVVLHRSEDGLEERPQRRALVAVETEERITEALRRRQLASLLTMRVDVADELAVARDRRQRPLRVRVFVDQIIEVFHVGEGENGIAPIRSEQVAIKKARQDEVFLTGGHKGFPN